MVNAILPQNRRRGLYRLLVRHFATQDHGRSTATLHEGRGVSPVQDMIYCIMVRSKRAGANQSTVYCPMEG